MMRGTMETFVARNPMLWNFPDCKKHQDHYQKYIYSITEKY